MRGHLLSKGTFALAYRFLIRGLTVGQQTISARHYLHAEYPACQHDIIYLLQVSRPYQHDIIYMMQVSRPYQHDIIYMMQVSRPYQHDIIYLLQVSRPYLHDIIYMLQVRVYLQHQSHRVPSSVLQEHQYIQHFVQFSSSDWSIPSGQVSSHRRQTDLMQQQTAILTIKYNAIILFIQFNTISQ